MMFGLLPRGDTIVQWVSPDGRITQLHGPEAVSTVIGEGPEGFGAVEVDNLFEAAARQHGETWVGYTLDHGEIDFPLHVLAGSADELAQKRHQLEGEFERFRPGWLCTYTVTAGWRWVAARLSRMQIITERDPGRRHEVTYELVLLVESPLAREANTSSEWVNKSGSGRGQLHLDPGPGEWPAWPQFILRGPGRFRLRWAGNDVEFPMVLRADEWVLVNTDEARPTIRSRDARGVDRNLWPQMRPGAKIEHPLKPREINRIDVSVTGGTRESSAWATVAVQHEGLV